MSGTAGIVTPKHRRAHKGARYDETLVLQRLDLRGFRGDLRSRLAPEPTSVSDSEEESVLTSVREILADVADRGDTALAELTERFDGCRPLSLRVSADERASALGEVTSELREALEFARDRIVAHHEAQRREPDPVETIGGITISDRVIPLERAGCYVPGGRADYPSTVLMTVLPARVAGVGSVVLCVPPGADGKVSPTTLAAAELAGADDVFCVGGAQAIAAMAYGTATIPAVDVIVGPGNRYVALAKRELSGHVRTDAFAGPSELVVIADRTVPADYIAADLLAQAEHGPGGVAALVTWEPSVAEIVDAEMARQLGEAARSELIAAVLREGGRSILVDGPSEALAAANAIAPEHLELMVAEPRDLLDGVRNAGAVFCGAFSPAAVGDYVAGVNHVLPTGGTARFADALRVADFQKHIHVVEMTQDALAAVEPHVSTLAAAEGLDAHGTSVARRVSTQRPS